jgi:ATP-dependent Clp protease ATP-binding subunit ClpA
LALIDDMNASGVMRVCDVDVDALRESLEIQIDRCFQACGAVLHAQGLGREMATGGDILVAQFEEKESAAVWLLGEQEMTRDDAAISSRRSARVSLVVH